MLLRRQLLSIDFERNILGAAGPSKLQVVLPDGTGGQDLRASPIPAERARKSHGNSRAADDVTEVALSEQWRSGQRDGLLSLVNTTPTWNEELRTYTLEYNGRATLASVKNIQLVPEGSAELHFQMGKVSEHRFNVDWKAPVSPIQAFAIALSVFDNKLACSPAPPSLRAAMRLRDRFSSSSTASPKPHADHHR